MVKKGKKHKNNKYDNNRGERIRKSELEKKSKKNEGDHFLVAFQRTHSESKGKGQGSHAISTCKITCRNKKHGGH